jgi:DivIVA domain-containing protein
MIDLTPLDVRKKRGDFSKVLRGYDPGEVDGFLELVESRLKTLVTENMSLSEEARRLNLQLEALESREKAVQDALVLAQQLREEVQSQTQREAESVRDRAIQESESLRDRVQKETDSLREQVERETEALRLETHREASILRDEAIREAATVRDRARREADLLWKEVTGEIDARVLQAEGIFKERQRALEELERSRTKFLKAFRSLLERELDSVEVEEARRPLEDMPLELNLRGWGGSQVEAAEDEEPAPSGPVEDSSDPEVGASDRGLLDVVPVGALDNFPSEDFGAEPPEALGREGAGAGWADDRSEDEAEAADAPWPAEEPDAPAVETTFGDKVDALLGADADDSDADPSLESEPLWFSSLLKQENEAVRKSGEAERSGPPPEGSPAEGAGAGEEDDEPRTD